ncbi:Histidinol dehydrogenase [Candidatus Vidania fulgoroideae]|nr:Histidinol dehydrogenase [Candidatus Vidania fulgoroideae]
MNIKISKFNNIRKKRKEISQKVSRIIKYVKKYKDDALVNLTKKYENRTIKKKDMVINIKKIDFSKLSKTDKKSLIECRDQIIKFHKLQKKYIYKSWIKKNKNFNIIGQILNPINKIGVYSPGGMTFYPSSIFMSVIPAIIAGVKKIYLFTPAKPSRKSLSVFYSAKICGLKKVYNIGGAQSIAAMSIGTKRIKRVNKIYGPGNIFVNEAKKKMFGRVGISNLAGPTEILILFDKKNKRKRIVKELFSQIEHDKNCFSVLISNKKSFLISIIKIIKKFIYKSKNKIIKHSIKNTLFFYKKKIKECIKLSNYFAPEHLSIFVKNPLKYLKYVKSAGTVFLGKKTYEPMGDYSIGINHVLPTNKSSKFSSPLGVYDFYKSFNIVSVKKKKKYKDLAKKIAEIEKLSFHKKVFDE